MIHFIAWQAVERPEGIFGTILTVPLDRSGEGVALVPEEMARSVTSLHVVEAWVETVSRKGVVRAWAGVPICAGVRDIFAHISNQFEREEIGAGMALVEVQVRLLPSLIPVPRGQLRAKVRIEGPRRVAAQFAGRWARVDPKLAARNAAFYAQASSLR